MFPFKITFIFKEVVLAILRHFTDTPTFIAVVNPGITVVGADPMEGGTPSHDKTIFGKLNPPLDAPLH